MKKRWFLIAFNLALALKLCGTPGLLFSEIRLSLKTIHYDLDIRLDYEQEKVFGHCRLMVINASSGSVSQIPLLLYRLMKVTSVKDEDGSELPYTQQVLGFEDWEKMQANSITVVLKTPLRPENKMSISIDYEGYLLGYTEAGMLYVKDHVDKDFTIIRPDCFAYPQVAYLSWKANFLAGLQSFAYRLRVTVPDFLTVANGGKFVGKLSENGWTTYSFENILPAWRIDAVVAKYGILKDPTDGHKVYHFPGDEEGGRMVLKALKDAMGLFTEWFGQASRSAEFSVIEVPEGFGSQADVTSILQTRDAFINKDKLGELYHEISHRWNVASRDPFPPRFESEGLAMLLQYLAKEKLEQKPGNLETGAERMRDSFRRGCQNDKKAKKIPMLDYGKEGLTDLSYSKGMVFFYVLYKLAGEEKLLNSIRNFYQKYHARGATTENFLSQLKDDLKIPLDKFFQDWVYGAASSDDIIGAKTLEEIVRKYRT